MPKVSKKSKTAKKVTKATLARRLFKRLKNRSRQNVIPKLIALGLTEAGASTYYNNLRKEFEDKAA